MTATVGTPDDSRLEALRLEFEQEASFNLVFVVLTVGASLIATLGLLANSPGVVIGAMVVAPWARASFAWWSDPGWKRRLSSWRP
jgi:hypothetical protein